MRVSKLFPKPTKTAPHDADTANAQFLIQGGFIDQVMAGVYSWLPLGLRVLRKVEQIIREEMNALGAQELLLPALHPKENWETTDRWDKVDVLFKLKSRSGKEYALGSTHEEIITPLVKTFVQSYKDLPLALYQIQTKFRDELRAKSGVLRGREFGMKDMYSFHATQADLDAFYEKAKQAYLNIFLRCGLEAVVTGASGGEFTKKMSHEFQVKTEAGEDVLAYCEACKQYFNKADVPHADLTQTDADGAQNKACPVCGGALADAGKGIEAGNIFDLQTKFSDAFDLEFQDKDGKKQKVIMGCYGMGTTRLVGTIVEASHDDKGIIWPKNVAPYQVELIVLPGGETEGEKLYTELNAAGVEVLFDDSDATPGTKFADADLIGCPVRLVISPKTLKENVVEWKERARTEMEMVKMADVIKKLIS